MPTLVLTTSSSPGEASWTDSSVLGSSPHTFVSFATYETLIPSPSIDFSSLATTVPAGFLYFGATLSFQMDFRITNTANPNNRNVFVGAYLPGVVSPGCVVNVPIPANTYVSGKIIMNLPYYPDGYLWGAAQWIPQDQGEGITRTNGIAFDYPGLVEGQPLVVTPKMETDFAPSDVASFWAGNLYVRCGK